jgi:outer membrane protein TolC
MIIKFNRVSGRSSCSGQRKWRILALAALLLAPGCTMPVHPLSTLDHEQRIQGDLQSMFASQEALSGPLTLHEAMARALKYNLDHRLKRMEIAHAIKQFDLAQALMIPHMNLSGGIKGRNNVSGSSSQSITTGLTSLETSSSQEKERFTTDLGITWNALDFGVSYYQAKQQADRTLIVQERRRKVAQNILHDVRIAYWNTLVAQRHLDRIGPLMNQVRTAMSRAQQIGQEGLTDPMDQLLYRRELLSMLNQLKSLRGELATAQSQLSALINLPPGTPFQLAPPQADDPLPELTFSMEQMETMALYSRPELAEETYMERVNRQEIRTAMLRMFPTLEFGLTGNYDDNKYLYKHQWVDFSGQIIANLSDIFNAPKRVAMAKQQVEVDQTRRMALTMAILTQVRIGWIQHQETRERYQSAQEMYQLDQAILTQASAAQQADAAGDLMRIRRALDTLVSQIQRDMAQNALQESTSQMLISLGADPGPEPDPAMDVATLAQQLSNAHREWFLGQVNTVALTQQPVPMASTPMPAPAMETVFITPETQATN